MGECSRWVYYILLRIIVYVPLLDALVLYDGIFVCGIIIYHSVGFLHCPSQQQGQCEGLRLEMDEEESHVFHFVGV